MDDHPSPSEHDLAIHRQLELFPKASRERRAVSLSQVEASPELQVLVLLRDVRDKAHPPARRRAWLARADALARSLSRYASYDLLLVLVRHAVLAGDEAGARRLALSCIDTMLAEPPPEEIAKSARLRDGLHRAVQALRVPILARTIGLELPDVVSRIVELARADRTTMDIHRLPALASFYGGLVILDADTTPLGELALDALRGREIPATVCSAYARRFRALALAASDRVLMAQLDKHYAPRALAGETDPVQLRRTIERDLARLAHDPVSPRSPFALELAKSHVAEPL